MEAPRVHREIRNVRVMSAAAVLGCLMVLSACDGSKQVTASSPKDPEPAETAPKPAAPAALTARSLERIPSQGVLIRCPDKSESPGLLLKSGTSSAARMEYFIVGSTPADAEKIRFACKASDQVLVASATRAAVLPNGLSVYSFTSGKSLTGAISEPPAATGPMYACRIEGRGSINDTERETITGKTAELREKLEQIRTRRREAMRNMRADRNRNDEIRRETRSSASEESGIAAEISNLNSRLEMPFDAVIGTQVAGAETREALEGDAVSLEQTILVAPDGSVRALRHQGKWISAKEVLATSSGGPSQVALKVSGNEGSVYVSCELEWSLPFGKPDCSMVAATTFELESLQGADIAERLSKVEPQAMSSNRSTSTGSRTLQWNGKPTSLWIKIFRNGEPDQPIIDEMILLDYPDRFIAKWGKPPSPLIKGPQPEPDSPPELAGERSTLDAGGSILDMIPAGDGSILMIRTDKPPYWAALDLKSGRFEDLPWKVGPDTLLTTQAGKIHLIDRKTKVVEIRDLASNQRTGLQVLQLEGDLVAAAAPLASPDSPLLITTDKYARFVDPANFEVVATGFDIDACFSGDDKIRGSFPGIDPLSARLRASGDGTLYTITANRMEGGSANPATFKILMDRSGIAIAENSHEQIMGIRGRRLTDYFSDHGGGDIRIRTVPSQESFPSPPGTIRFTGHDGNKVIAELRSAPVVPWESRKRAGALPYDRTVYYDSSLGVLVLPDDTKVHIIHIKLPEQAQARPDFVFTGEDMEIPLPPGRDHKLILEPQGETSISGNLAIWKVPAHFDRSQVHMKLEWTGELGTTLTRNFHCAVVRQAPAPIVASPDGKTRRTLRRTGIIAPEAGIYGFAGGGNVILTSSGSDQEAWSLTTCEKLFSRKESIQAFLGDADQIYLIDDKGVLKSFDMMTGNPIAEAAFGTRDSGSKGLAGITTGISSKGPLLAVERDEMNRYVALIDRKSLQSRLMNFSREIQQLFFIPQFKTNPSGSATWSFTAGVFREGINITAQSFQATPHLGEPDETGRYVVGRDGILDIKATPPVMTPFAGLPGVEDHTDVELDVSGRYLLFRNHDSKLGELVISIRSVRTPAVEILKLIVPSNHGISKARVISGTNKLVLEMDSSRSRLGVFELDIPSLAKDLAARPGHP